MTLESQHLFINACLGRPVERTPVWIMRQAGRYLPEYRALRKSYDFTTMYKTPELAAEVTLQPIDIIGVDAAILFSDILVIPEALGMTLQFVKGKGPQFPSPIREERDLQSLGSPDVAERLYFVMDAIRLVRKSLDNRVSLIGFAGAPWTVVAYMIEGGGSKNFKHVRQWRYARPDLLHQLMDKVTTATIDYCKAKIEAGAEAIQLFDSWAGLLDPDGFETIALPYAKRIIESIKKPGVPIIYFAKGAGIWLDKMMDCGADVLGLDWTINPEAACRQLKNNVALQGNLDPTALYAPPEKIREMVQKMLSQFKQSPGYIANLGHGILPDIPPSHAKAFVDAVKELSATEK